MTSFARLSLLIPASALLGGCAGLLIDSIGKSAMTGGTYAEMSNTLPAATGSGGRVYIYRTAESTKTSLVGTPIISGALLLKNPTICTVGGSVHEVLWEAFRYFDLPEGQHEITCGNDVLKRREGWRETPVYQRGANRLQVSVAKTTEHFVRIDPADEPALFRPVMVGEAQGREEIKNLPYQKDGKAWRFVPGKVSE